MHIVWFQKISIPSIKVTVNSCVCVCVRRGGGGGGVQIPKGYVGKRSNLFPEGPRTLSKGNQHVRRSNFRSDKTINPLTPIYFSILK